MERTVLEIGKQAAMEASVGPPLHEKMLQLLVDTEKPDILLCTHRTHVVGHKEKDQKSILERHEILYNPYALFMSLPEQWHAEVPEGE